MILRKRNNGNYTPNGWYVSSSSSDETNDGRHNTDC